MTTMIDGPTGPAARAAQDGRQAELRQDRWLYDLEQALIEQGMKRYVPQQGGQGDAAAPQPSGREAAVAPMTAALPTEGAALLAADAPAASAPVRTSVAAASASTTTDEGSGRPATLAGGAQQGVTGATAAEPLRLNAVPVATSAGNAATVAGLVAPPSVSLTSAAVQPATSQAPSLAVTARVAAGPLWPGQAGGDSPVPSPEASVAGEEQATPAAGESDAPTEPFEKRLLHLYYGKDGVHAWLRDAELNAAQARGLAQALAGELVNAGQRLAELTINGRKVNTRPGLPQADDELPPAAGRQLAPLTIRSSE